MRCSQELMSLAELIKTCVPQAVKFIQVIPQIQPTVSKASRVHKGRSGPTHAVCGPMKTVVGPNMICYWELHHRIISDYSMHAQHTSVHSMEWLCITPAVSRNGAACCCAVCLSITMKLAKHRDHLLIFQKCLTN